MEQLMDLADDRLINGCIYCGGPAETRDHVPSRILIESPYPENLPVVGACRSCNNSFSKDEQYFVCLIESAIAGSTNPDMIRRTSVAKALRRSPALRTQIESMKSKTGVPTVFEAEPERVKNVLLKLARGHAAFELSQLCREEPDCFIWWPISIMSSEEREAFDAGHLVEQLGEIGSRGSQRIVMTEVSLRSMSGELTKLRLLINGWLNVQKGFYRYIAIDDYSEIRIKIVIAEYLACEVAWMK
ncbi:hypothetical protein MalM14_37260 [Gimesia chilikensis]|nr:hypothetical protein MalM14_37260 [Gimesia chilikensis]